MVISVRGLNLRIGAFALHDISLEVPSGDYFVLLGPTGSGKTLLVECLCGLLRPDGGTIEIGGRDVTRLAPRHRGCGYVPQHQGLFPHLRVRDNIAFPLRAQGVAVGEIPGRVAPLVELLGIGYLLERWPAHLSGGERQKVALARALASRPKVLVLDEPVSALDEASRERLCGELRRIHGELGITTLHVSHSVEEALSVGTRAALFNGGRVAQAGPLPDLLRRPASEFVARFFRTENILAATAAPLPDGQGSQLTFAGHRLTVPGSHQGAVTFVIRPESIQVALDRPQAASSPGTRHSHPAHGTDAIPALLKHVSDRGLHRRLEFDAGVPLVAYSTLPAEAFSPGGAYALALPPEAIHVLDLEPGSNGARLDAERPIG